MVHPISSRGFTEKESEVTKEPEEQGTNKIENAEKKSPCVGLNPSYRTPTKRRRAIPSDYSDMAVLL